jgi:[ribosomal protein S5]-alanine N-acetyltransferase
MSKILVETPTIDIRKFIQNDAEFLCRLMNSPQWLQFIGDRGILSQSVAKKHIKNALQAHFKKHGFGFLVVIEKASNKAIGMCGIVKRDYMTHPDLGFAFLPEFQGKGLAFEAAESILQLAKKEWNLNEIQAITNKSNDRSIHLLLKLGFVLNGEISVPNETESLNLFYKKLE